MNVLAIIGSPRKGNTYRIVQQIEERMKGMGDVEFDYLFLKDAHLEHCRGCFTCISRGEDLCPIEDDREKIEERMLDSDGVIIASPVYAWNVSGLTKNFIDRFAYVAHRPRFFNQRLLLVSTTAGSGLKPTLKALSFFEAGGFVPVYKLGLRTTIWQPNAEERDKIERGVEKAATKFFDAMKAKERPSPTVGSLLHFNALRAMGPLVKKYLPRDYEYWFEKGWYDEERYFTDVEMGLFKRTLGRIIEKVFRYKIKRSLSHLARD